MVGLVFKKLKSLDHPVSEEEKKPAPAIAKTTTPPPSKSKTNTGAPTATISSRISSAKTVSELLQISGKNCNRQQAMAILTKLSVWTASNKANVNEFENDYRFLKICRQLSHVETQKNTSNFMNQHLQQKSAEVDMLLSIAGDDEASKIIENLSLPQKVKSFTSLAQKKNRSISILKTLASTISSHTEKMNLKECSDLLFAMNSLNFIDEMLLCRISMDISEGLAKNMDKTAVVGSIVTSLGFIKYKDPALLDKLTESVITKQELYRTKDLSSLILTLALVNYRPKNIDAIISQLLPKISQSDLTAIEWLDYVWALTVLELHQPKNLESVLR